MSNVDNSDQVCDRCERPWNDWPAGRCVVCSTDKRGLCNACVQAYESTGATIDVQWFPGAEWTTKP